MDDKQNRIRERAYALWQQAGEPHGSEMDHWAQAAREIEADEQGEDPVPLDATRASGEDIWLAATASPDKLTAPAATRATSSPSVVSPGAEAEGKSRRPL